MTCTTGVFLEYRMNERKARAAYRIAAAAALFLAFGCSGGETGEGRDGRLVVTAALLTDDEASKRADLAGMRMCASSEELDLERCVDVPLPEADLVVALNVPPGEDWIVRVFAFDWEGRAIWMGRTRMSSWSGESSRARVLLSLCSEITMIPCAEDLQAPACGLHHPRAFHSMTELPGGLVLIAGGFSSVRDDATCDPECSEPDLGSPGDFVDDEGQPCTPMCRLLRAEKTAEVYDPMAGRVVEVFDLSSPRAMHTATPTQDRRNVILAGGVSSARLYLDGEAPLFLPHSFPMMPDGTATAEVLHAFLRAPVREIGTAGPRLMHAAVDGGDEGVLLIGGLTVKEGSVRFIGDSSDTIPMTELLAPEGAGSFGLSGLTPRRGHGAVRLGREVVVMGGNDVDAHDPGPFGELWDLRVGTAGLLGEASRAGVRQRRYAPMWLTLTPLSRGRLLALGGIYESEFVDASGRSLPSLTPLSSGLILDMSGELVEGEVARMVVPRAAHSATVLESGEVLLTGGLTIADELRVTRSIESYDPETNESRGLERSDERPLRLLGPRFGHRALRLPDGTVLRSGGLVTLDPNQGGSNGPCGIVACDLDLYNPHCCDLSPPPAASLLE